MRKIVREELDRFFANKVDRNIDEDQIGGVLLAMEVTGLARPTIYSRASNRTIPHRKQGKNLYFSRMELKAWIEAGRRKTRTDDRSSRGEFSLKNSIDEADGS